MKAAATAAVQERNPDASSSQPGANPALAGARCAYDLDRFVRAQAGVYGRALGELRAGHKISHWMWFVFPQILGLGNSGNARFYGLEGLAEARAYAAHGLLGPRLGECTEAMLGWAGERSALAILGVIDSLKFNSSMTLFEQACPHDPRFAAAIEAFYNGRRDSATLDLIAA